MNQSKPETIIVFITGLALFFNSVIGFIVTLIFIKNEQNLIVANTHQKLYEKLSEEDEEKLISPSYSTAPEPIQKAVIKFNTKPDSAIQWMKENQVIEGRADEVAKFLFEKDNLNIYKVGDFLSDVKNFSREVLKEYLKLFDFTNVSYENAIRIFLSKFHLPGEAQKIDRVMEQFASRYCECNPGVFPNPDTAYILSFSIIMLNTDAHQSAIKHKMTKKQFIQNNKGIALGKDLPEDFLNSIYDNVVKNVIKIDSDPILRKAVHHGWLYKQGTNNQWQKHYFVVSNNCLYYYTSEKDKDKDPHVIIPLEGLSVQLVDMKGLYQYCFKIFNSSGAEKVKSVKLLQSGPKEGQHKHFLLAAESEEQLNIWMAAIQVNVVQNPIQQLISKKKEIMQSQTIIKEEDK